MLYYSIYIYIYKFARLLNNAAVSICVGIDVSKSVDLYHNSLFHIYESLQKPKKFKMKYKKCSFRYYAHISNKVLQHIFSCVALFMDSLSLFCATVP